MGYTYYLAGKLLWPQDILDAFGIKGDYGLLALLVLPKRSSFFWSSGLWFFFSPFCASAIYYCFEPLPGPWARLFVTPIAGRPPSPASLTTLSGSMEGGWTLLLDKTLQRFCCFNRFCALYPWYYVLGLVRVYALRVCPWKGRANPADIPLEEQGIRKGPLDPSVQGTDFNKILASCALVANIFLIYFCGGFPFYWISGLFLSFFTGFHLPGMITIYSGFSGSLCFLHFDIGRRFLSAFPESISVPPVQGTQGLKGWRFGGLVRWVFQRSCPIPAFKGNPPIVTPPDTPPSPPALPLKGSEIDTFLPLQGEVWRGWVKSSFTSLPEDAYEGWKMTCPPPRSTLKSNL